MIPHLNSQVKILHCDAIACHGLLPLLSTIWPMSDPTPGSHPEDLLPGAVGSPSPSPP